MFPLAVPLGVELWFPGHAYVSSAQFSRVGMPGVDFHVVCGKAYPQVMKLASESLGYLNVDFHRSALCLSSVACARVLGAARR